MRRAEILAPAGSYDAFLAAVHNGCDAVYLGGKAYGARAYADNFDLETLERAIAYAKGFGVKVYYTVNTLFKEKELEGLLNHLEAVIAAGVDALILQDIGVLRLVNQVFPGMELHASTQMNCHSLEGVRFLETLGVARVVPARELNLEEIKHIRANSELEIECFVHGALCYCYSGQCLMSSFLGGRSGNRGRCAQPCRLQYKGIIEDRVYDQLHMLSPKDIETLSILPELLVAGIHSFKIEGRMKNPEYVGLMTRLYRHYRDLALSGETYEVRAEDVEDMLQAFNRGAFSSGYYKQHNGPEMMAMTQPKHQGIVIGQVKNQNRSKVMVSLSQPLRAGDSIEFLMMDGTYHSLIVQQSLSEQGIFNIKGQAAMDTPVHRIKSMELAERMKNTNAKIHKQPIKMKGTFRLNQPASLTLSTETDEVTVTGELVQAAVKQGMTKDQIEKQLRKTGTYPMDVTELMMDLDENIFMPVSHLNALRRSAFDALVTRRSQRISHGTSAISLSPQAISRQSWHHRSVDNQPTQSTNITVLLKDRHQFETVLAYDVKRIYLEWVNFRQQELEGFIAQARIKQPHTQIYLALPRILRQEKADEIRHLFASVPEDLDGFLIRSMDGWHHVAELGKPFVWDYSMNVLNQQTVEVLMSKEGSERYMPSLELKFGEHKGLSMTEAEVLVYGHVSVMTSAQCVRKNLEGCVKDQGHILYLKDRKEMQVPVETFCRLCYNNIYNSQPLWLVDQMDQFMKLGAHWYRYDFLNESPETIHRILGGAAPETYTRGHFNKGIE